MSEDVLTIHTLVTDSRRENHPNPDPRQRHESGHVLCPVFVPSLRPPSLPPPEGLSWVTECAAASRVCEGRADGRRAATCPAQQYPEWGSMSAMLG